MGYGGPPKSPWLMYEFRLQHPLWLALDDAAERCGMAKAVFIREAIREYIIQKLGVDLVAEYAPLIVEHSHVEKSKKRPRKPAVKPAVAPNTARCLHCNMVLVSTSLDPVRCRCLSEQTALTISGGPFCQRRQYGPLAKWIEGDGTEWENGTLRPQSSTKSSEK